MTNTNPDHYKKGIETWDYIVSWDMGYLEGNIIKYITRYKYKNGIEDLEKALKYLIKLIRVKKHRAKYFKSKVYWHGK